MLRCIDNSIYTGITTDVNRRMKEHFNKEKKCAKYTMNHLPTHLEAVWTSSNRVSASRLEFFIKRLSKKDKEYIIKNNSLELLSNKIDINNYTQVSLEIYKEYVK